MFDIWKRAFNEREKGENTHENGTNPQKLKRERISSGNEDDHGDVPRRRVKRQRTEDNSTFESIEFDSQDTKVLDLILTQNSE
jgi:hypothetical protein